jgi:single-strand DNA-binding protein
MKLNHCILSGRCGSDIEIKVISDNFSVGTVNICTDESYKAKNGEWQSPANWVTVKITNQNILKFADKIALKGVEVCVHGAIKTETWETEAGKRSRTLIEIQPFKGDIQQVVREKAGSSTPAPAPPEQPPNAKKEPEQDNPEEDLPF